MSGGRVAIAASDAEYHDAKAAAEALAWTGVQPTTKSEVRDREYQRGGDRLVARHVTAAIGGDCWGRVAVGSVRPVHPWIHAGPTTLVGDYLEVTSGRVKLSMVSVGALAECKAIYVFIPADTFIFFVKNRPKKP